MYIRGKVTDKKIVVFLLLIPFFKPESFQYIAPGIDELYDYLRIADAVLITILYVKRVLLKRNIETFIYLLSGYELILVISTVINNQNIKNAVINAILVIVFCMFIEMEIKDNYVNFITALYILLYVLVLINFVVLIYYPSGIAQLNYYYYPVNFWHIDNHMVNLLVFAVAIGLLYRNIENAIGQWTVSVLIIICTLTTVILWSATGVVGFFAYILFLFLISNKPWQKYFHSFLVYGVTWGISILIVFMRIQTLFNNIIENVLKKKVNLSGRTEMWDKAIILIKDNLLLGYGVPLNHGYVFWHYKFYYTHNGILEILIQGGIFALLLSGALYLVSARTLFQYRKNKVTGIVLGAIVALMITLWTEAYINEIEIYGLLMISCLIPYIEKQQIRVQKRCYKIVRPKIVMKKGQG